MRILVLSTLYPFPAHLNGATRRLAPVLKDLCQRHAVTLLFLAREPVTLEQARAECPGLAGLIPVPWKRPEARFQGYFRCFWEFDHPPFRQALAMHLKPGACDLVFAFMAGMAQYGPLLERTARVLDTVDSHSLYMERRSAVARTLRERLSCRHDAWLASSYERKYFPAFHGCFTAGPEDNRRVRSQAPALPTWTIPTSVDTDYFDLPARLEAPPRIVFSGRLDYRDNVVAALHLAREVFPRIRAAVPEATLAIVGGWATDEVKALAGIPGIVLPGFVQDLREEYRVSSVFVAPLQSGAGIKCKVIEAMAMRTPVVMRPLAAEGCEYLDPSAAVIASDPAAMAEAAVALLRDPARAAAMGEAARAYVLAGYSTPVVNRKIERILMEVAGRFHKGIR